MTTVETFNTIYSFSCFTSYGIPIPYMTFNEFHYAITQALASFEGITRFEWDQDDFAYIIEYASRPLEETSDLELLKIIRNKKCVANEAAYQAGLRHTYDDEIDLFEQVSFKRRWSKCKIFLRRDLVGDCLTYEFIRLKGDRISFIDMKMAVEKHFNKINEIQKNLKDALVEDGVDIDSINLRDYLRDYLMCDLV